MSAPTTLSKRELAALLGDYAAEGLGTGAAPFALLGLTPAPCSKAQIEAALQRQLDRLQQHPQGDSPAADQARIMLHEAATALLDGRKQSQLIAAAHRARESVVPSRPSAAPQPAAASAPPPPRPVRRERVGDPLVARALVIGLGVVVVMIVVVVVGSMVRSSGSTAANQSGTPAAGNGAQTLPPTDPDASAPVETAATPTAPDDKPASEVPKSAAAPRADTPWSPRTRSQFVDPSQVVRELRAAADTVRTDPDKGLIEFERACNIAADWWCRFEPAQMRAAADAIAEFLYRVGSRRELAQQTLAVVEAPSRALNPAAGVAIGADDVWPAAWSAGLLTRFHRERDLPPGVATQVAAAVDRALGDARPARSSDATFEAGVAAAFRKLPRAILSGQRRGIGATSDPAAPDAGTAMTRWVEGITLYCKADQAERERYLTAALGWLLIGAAEPEADARVFAAINLLAAEIKWRAGGAARSALIEWFNDPRVSSSDLRVLTAAIASRSSAEGVNSTMALPMTARPEDRAALRDVYAKAWGLAEASARAESAGAWLSAADAALEFKTDPVNPAAQIACAAAYARLTTAAATIWRGGAVDATIAWEQPAGVENTPDAAPNVNRSTLQIHVTMPNSGSAAATGNGQDGIWTQEYLSERNSIPGRMNRLDELSLRGRPIGPIDAGLLAQAAVAESPWKVREHAQLVLRVFAEEPALIEALLDFLPIAPRTTDVSRLYSDVSGVALPAPADPAWEIEARRAMLSRLMSMLTSTGVHGEIENSAAAIARAYLAAVDRKLTSELPTADEVAEGASAAIVELSDRLAREARSSPVSGSMRFNLDAIERRRAQRRLQASGPVQSFAAEQSGLLELLAFAVASDRPAGEALVAQILDEAAARRRKASHVFEQLLANERAMMRLWMLRYKEPDAQ